MTCLAVHTPREFGGPGSSPQICILVNSQVALVLPGEPQHPVCGEPSTASLCFTPSLQSTYQNPSLGVDIVIASVSQKGTLRHDEVRSLVQAFTLLTVSLALHPLAVLLS